MKQDEIIEMARQAGYHSGIAMHDVELLETFAKIVAKKAYLEGVNSGISAEREACAKVCESMPYRAASASKAAEAIRARGEA